MFSACGISNYTLSLFHLWNHAFFKALLFLSAGYIIHALSDEQDIRKMGGLIKEKPYIYIYMLIGSLSLMGFPFLSGYYSKELILSCIFFKHSPNTSFIYFLGLISVFFTAFYSTRLILIVFFNEGNIKKTQSIFI